MKKIAALLLCVFLLLACCVTVCATGELTEKEPEETVSVTTTVPDGLALKVMATNVQICIDGIAAESFTITRQDTPTLELTPAEDFYIKAVYLNGEDVTGRVKDGRLTLDPVFEVLELVVLRKRPSRRFALALVLCLSMVVPGLVPALPDSRTAAGKPQWRK